MKYSQEITYTDFWGCKTTCGVIGYENIEEAKKDAVYLAEKDGWTNPKWWQWWRRNDTVINF